MNGGTTLYLGKKSLGPGFLSKSLRHCHIFWFEQYLNILMIQYTMEQWFVHHKVWMDDIILKTLFSHKR